MMRSTFMQKAGERLVEEKDVLVRVVREAFYQKHEEASQELSKVESEDYLAELLHRIGQTLVEMNETGEKVYIEEWAKRFGKLAVESGVSVDRAMLVLPILRKEIYDFIREDFKQMNMPLEDYFYVADVINPMFDQVLYSFTHTYVEYNEQTFKQAQEELMELSVPVVPLTKEVAILPIIGTIDTHRSKELLEKSLNRGRELELSYLIVDLSGVHVIDTAIAHNLFQLNDALKIIGVTAVISGLRPELVQTIVNLGISFKHMHVVRNLEQALQLTGLKIRENSQVLKI
ncbi:STAS domain-containing protein [Salipaludibacillus sp. LMS25]|uniref:STAS domain-containing protein n=1 Tax=Salipaludibacillus sp. LMS25 TaxID=2924031 RepID=UPI0020D07EE6|nr:STAS domain-containing protein [Salipaludibacillus sp. LMS25]UTR14176.1 STAS domain-containing protein [Salipaludibacillus sp. LMS25]